MSAILDHFGYPPPHLDQWQQHVWYDLGTAQELLHQMRNHLVRGLPAIANPSRAESSSSTEPTTMPIHPSYGGKSVKVSKEGGSAPRAATTRASSTAATTSPKTEIKKKKKRKAVKHTVTSETVCSPETKKKLISESPDSQAEGPYCDSKPTESAPENSPPAP